MRRIKKTVAILILFVLVATVLWFRSRKASESVPVSSGPIIEAIYGLGTVRTERDFEIKVAVPGMVMEVHVQEGQEVKKGDPLIRVDESGLFRAPFSGMVTSVPFHVGDTVFAQQPMLKLEDIRHRYVEVSLEQRGALRIRKGQEAKLVFESIRNERFKGEVQSVYSRAGDFIARIAVESLPSQVLPGMTADVAIEVAHKASVVLLPLAAVSNGRVLRERNSERTPIEVRLGAIDGIWAEVLEGDVRLGDTVIVKKPRSARESNHDVHRG